MGVSGGSLKDNGASEVKQETMGEKTKKLGQPQ